jgi:hypothetical protein
MKFAATSGTHQNRTDQLRPDRATAQALRTAFPTVQHLRIELRFQGPASNVPAAQSHVLYPPARAFFEYRCPYSDCDGQFDLDAAVKAALADPGHRAHGILGCRGSRGLDPTSRRLCPLELLYDITATYRPEPT